MLMLSNLILINYMYFTEVIILRREGWGGGGGGGGGV